VVLSTRHDPSENIEFPMAMLEFLDSQGFRKISPRLIHACIEAAKYLICLA
jgi:hypothetical protein